MRTFHCATCDADLVDWPRSQSVDENGALMPAETTREAHARQHMEMAALGAPFRMTSEI